MSKRLIKQAAVAVLLTTSVLSFSPVALGASNSVDQSVSKAKAELSKATTHYVNPSLAGKLAPSSALYPALNSAKKNYQLSRSAVNATKLSTAQKQAKLKEIDGLYSKNISGGLVPYIDAYNYATQYLEPILKDIKAAEARNDFAAVESGYHKLSVQLNKRSAILYRFSGKAARDLLLNTYKKPADEKRAELMVPVTIYMDLIKINDLLTADKLVEAKAKFAEVEALLVRLPSASSNKLVAALLEGVAKVRAVLNPTTPVTPAPPTTPVTPPVSGGGGETTPVLTPQQALDVKIVGLVAALNVSQGTNVTVSMPASNSLKVTLKKDVAIAEFLGLGFYQTFTKQLNVTKVNGFDTTSVEALNYLKSAFPAGAVNLYELKGKTVTLPITVNNGTALNVNFTITFE